MKFIVLVGKNNTGKTAVLKSVIDDLIENGADIVDNKSFYRFGTYVKSKSGFSNHKKIETTILLKTDNNLIGITTYGDDEKYLVKKINLFINIGCTHIIFASHPEGSSYKYLVTLADSYGFQNFHAVFKIGCVGITNHPNLTNLKNASDDYTKNEILNLI